MIQKSKFPIERFILLWAIFYSSTTMAHPPENDIEPDDGYILYLDVINAGRYLERFIHKEFGTVYSRTHLRIPGSECAEDDFYSCVVVPGIGLGFAVPKKGIALNLHWAYGEYKFEVIDIRYIPWDGEIRDFFLIKSNSIKADEKTRTNHYVYNRQFGLIMFYADSRTDEACGYCILSRTAFVLTEPERGFGAVPE